MCSTSTLQDWSEKTVFSKLSVNSRLEPSCSAAMQISRIPRGGTFAVLDESHAVGVSTFAFISHRNYWLGWQLHGARTD